jgi:hypothetical protein
MLMVHEPVKETIDEKLEKKPRYEMRPRKANLSIDLNRPPEEEHELKNGSRVKEEIKPKIEGDRDMNESNQQVQALKQHNDSMRQ